MKRLPVERKIAAGFVVALAILGIVGAAGYWSIVRLERDTKWVEHTGEVLLTLETVLSSAQDVETGQRSYALTGEDSFLKPYYDGVNHVEETFRRLRRLTAEDSREQKRLDELKPVIDEEVAFAKQTIERRKRGFDGVEQATLAARGKVLLDRIRDSISEMENTERELMKKRQEKARTSSQFALGVIAAASLLAFAFVGTALWMIQRDIARRRRVEEALAKSNAELGAVLDASTPVALIAMDTHGAITFFNSGAERMLGYQSAEVVGKISAVDFFLDSEIIAETKRRTATIGRTLHGFDVLVDGARRGEVEEREWTFVRKDGSQLTGSAAVTLMREADGGVAGFMMVARDITERKRSEQLLRAMNDELKAFAYTVSHDLKTPLRGISGYAQELERLHSTGLSERARFCLHQIIAATGNLDRLIEDLLLYSRLDAESPKLAEVNVMKLIEGVLKDRSSAVAELGAEVEVAVPFATIHTWERGLVQVLANLLNNALKYSRGSNPPQIRFGGKMIGNGWRISVADNGIGFDMKYHDRIFGLFNRLVQPEQFEGTGAGLAIAKKLLDKLQGKIWAESEPGRGATFYIELPRSHQPETDL